MSEVDTKEKIEKVPEQILGAIESYFERAIRGTPESLDAYLANIDKAYSIEGTSTKVHCHVLKLDGNRRPRVDHLAQFLVDIIIEYAIPRLDIEAAFEHRKKTGSSEKVAGLQRKAQELFVDLASNSGEGGEVLLFALTERYLGLPQLICKMPLKTSTQMHYHGIDGVHAKVDKEKNRLYIYWGESKLHKEVESALSECLDTITEFLNSTGTTGSRSDRDIELIRDNISIENPDAQEAIIAMLDDTHPLYNQIEFRAVCLVGFDFEHYPKKPMQKTLEEVLASAEEALNSWKNMVRKRINFRENMPTFEIEILLIPFPDVEKFRSTFVQQLGFK